MNKSVKYITVLGVSTAAAMVLSFVETLIPNPFPVPGVKLGLANLVTLFLLLKVDWRSASIVAAIRVILTAILFGNFASLAYSAAGAALSMLVMILLKRAGVFSTAGISIAGAVSHNAGQILMAVILFRTGEIIWWLPALIVSGVVTGLAIGAAGAILVKKVELKL